VVTDRPALYSGLIAALVWPEVGVPRRGAVGAIMSKYRTLGVQQFEGDVASKSGCEGDPAVGYRNVEAVLMGDRSDEGMAVER
jgi:hypothetical protein